MGKNIYWQSIRGICILAVVLIHSIGGIEGMLATDIMYVLVRKLINFAVAIFVFMSGYFVNVKNMMDDTFDYIGWLKYRGGDS